MQCALVIGSDLYLKNVQKKMEVLYLALVSPGLLLLYNRHPFPLITFFMA